MTWDGRNRRKFPRVVFPCLIKVSQRDSGEDLLLTHTEDISVGGLSIFLKTPLALSTKVDIVIDLMDADDHIRCQGCVVWSQQRKTTEAVKPGFYETGVEFMDLKQEDLKRLQAIVAHAVNQGKTIKDK